jgi:hypothetical protein
VNLDLLVSQEKTPYSHEARNYFISRGGWSDDVDESKQIFYKHNERKQQN